MDEQIRKSYMLRARLRNADLTLLEAVSRRHNCNLSETVREAIHKLAESEGLYNIAGFVIEGGTEANHADKP
jgi:hypothetical protein